MAARFFVNGGVDNNWSTLGNWSTTTGGAGGSAVPSSLDDVHFDANSPNCTVNTSNRVALSLDFTGYTNTITMSVQITVGGSVTLVSAMTIAGAGALIVNAAATITSNGKTWPNALTLTGGVTQTLVGDLRVGGLLTIGTTSTNTVLNGDNLYPLAGVRIGAIGASCTGTSIFQITVTQTLDSPLLTTGRGVQNPLVINAPGQTITVSATFPIRFDTFQYLAGTVISGNTWPSSSGGMILSRLWTGM